MPKFYVTFGNQYRHEAHPVLAEAHPDAYVTVIAESLDQAHHMVTERLGDTYSMIYTEPNFDQDLFPLGSVANI